MPSPRKPWPRRQDVTGLSLVRGKGNVLTLLGRGAYGSVLLANMKLRDAASSAPRTLRRRVAVTRFSKPLTDAQVRHLEIAIARMRKAGLKNLVPTGFVKHEFSREKGPEWVHVAPAYVQKRQSRLTVADGGIWGLRNPSDRKEAARVLASVAAMGYRPHSDLLLRFKKSRGFRVLDPDLLIDWTAEGKRERTPLSARASMIYMGLLHFARTRAEFDSLVDTTRDAVRKNPSLSVAFDRLLAEREADAHEYFQRLQASR